MQQHSAAATRPRPSPPVVPSIGHFHLPLDDHHNQPCRTTPPHETSARSTPHTTTTFSTSSPALGDRRDPSSSSSGPSPPLSPSTGDQRKVGGDDDDEPDENYDDHSATSLLHAALTFRPPHALFHSPQSALFASAYSSPSSSSSFESDPKSSATKEAAVRILDVGCRSGLWAIAVARAYPGVQVIAVDDNPSLFGFDSPPADGPLPPNLQFIVGRFGDPLPFPKAHFDLVHSQCTLARAPDATWRASLADMVRVAKPGGYVDVVELYRYPQNTGPLAVKYTDIARQYYKSIDADPALALKLDTIVEDLGVADVQEGVSNIPISWNGRIGAMAWSLHRLLATRFLASLTEAGALSQAGLAELLRDIKKEYHDRMAFFVAYFACGRVVG
ncbi:S-adenosyl-L-methionine-dependent methyltransferase [Zopfochytrium polystomum]|nr:S-adenosyl-L-methionine-dependent methyltransferase [Zopfochytrium polystomum]